jgi:subtilisin-like proprotein convertase family protein
MMILFIFTNNLFSQTTNPWTFVQESTIQKENQERRIIPNEYKTATVDLASLQKTLDKSPQRFSNESQETQIVLSLPFPDGSFKSFRIEKWSVMHPDLAAKFPEIQTYVGYGVEDPTANVRLDITPHGFHAMIRSGRHNTVFIDPYAFGETDNYVVYFKKDFTKDIKDDLGCFYQDVNKNIGKTASEPNHQAEQGDCDLRTYRLALACTGEYATFHGGTTSLVAAAFVTTMNRVNGIFENEAAIHMQLVPNNDLLIFLDANTDPYTNNNGGAMLGENQTECDNTIGSANYDIGHVFSTGGGGVAYLGSVCNNSIKAGGVTGQPSPVGDPFDVDYVSHEIGHQFGANHTQNNSCNRNGSTAMEPGSASTIMGYAGICSPNVQSNSDDYFHAISLQEMGNFVTGNGNSCAAVTVTGNGQPTAAAGADFTIPKSTPFVLTGVGTDPQGTASLTYSWEQMDNEVGSMPPSSTNTVGPMFRSEKYTSSPSRYFPNLPDLLNNVTPTWEVLASVARTYDFRFTVRDNYAGAGCTAEDDMTVTVDGSAGPFEVTAPNTNVTWSALSNQTVTWNVAGSDVAPVNAPNVDILLSTDGGQTYPTTLASAVPNDGSETVTLPNVTSSTARIMVRGSNHIFFDISNTDFTISAPLTDFTLSVSPSSQTACVPANAIYVVDIGATGGFSGNINLSVSGVPTGATSSFSTNPVSAPGTSDLTIGNTSNATPGTYTLTISATGSTGTKTEDVELIISSGSPGVVSLSSPSDGATGVSDLPTLSWNAVGTASSYNLELSDDAGFVNIIENPTGITGNSFTITNALTPNTTYYWRVQGVNTCGTGNFSASWSFTTANQICKTYTSTDVPKNISSSGTPVITSTLTINDSGTIDDVDLNNLKITHTWVNDLVVSITSPNGTTVKVLDQLCNSQNNVDINFDDEASNSYNSIPCPPVGGGNYQPLQSLSAFDGEDLNGLWTLTVEDLVNQDGGSLDNWELHICYTGSSVPPLTVTTAGTNISCNGGSDGTATATPSGGSTPYTYLWTGGGTTASISNLSEGTYTVTVTENGGMTATSSVTLTEPPVLNLTTSSTTATCGNSNGSATVSASGGTTPYTYAWSNGGTTATISNLAPGTYTVDVTDANNCVKSTSVVVMGTNAITATTTSTNVTCSGCSDGTASANAANGSGNYSYNWSNGGSTQSISGLGVGTYDVTITDTDTQCTVTASAVVSEQACTISEMQSDTITSGNQTIMVSDTITSIAQISGSANVQYFAEKSIILKPGFKGTSSNKIVAKIQDCAIDCFDGIQNGDETGIDCGGSTCPACPTACLVMQILNDTISVGNHLFNVTDTITSTAFYTGTANVEYNAGKSILLKPGFSSIAGAQFLAKILSCAPQPLFSPDEGITEVLFSIEEELEDKILDENIDSPHILIYPNPAQSDLQIQIKTERLQPIEISVQNALGRIMTQRKENLSSSVHQTSLTVSDYPPGIYWLSVRFMEDGDWQVVQFVKN